MRDYTNKPTRSPDWIKRGLWTAFLLSAVITAVLALRKPDDPRDGIDPAQPDQNLPENTTPGDQPDINEGSPLQTNSNRPEKVELDLDQTVYFLLTGLDTREWEGDTGPGLTDTIMVAYLNAETLNAGLISIPRDTWVEVPEYGPYKINQAYSLGEAYGYTGGGPGLLMDTAGDFLDIEIDYYVQVDFQAFVVLVDSVNGVMVDVPQTILVWPNAEMEGDMKRLQPGVQVLPGNLALGYVRTRDTEEGDFGRTKRQQQVLVGLQKKVFSYEILPVLLPRLPGLYRDLAKNVETNLTLNQLISLAWTVRDIDPRSISTRVIDQPLVEPGINERDQYVLFPNLENIRKIWNDMQNLTATLVPEPTLEISFAERVAAENATVAVFNGTVSPGLATETADYLIASGVNIIEVGNSGKFKDQTYIYDYSGNPYTVQMILDLMGFSQNRLFYRSDPSITADVVIVLGADWVLENTIPTPDFTD
jgi:LCP family protein required for cell wall assembly